MDDLVVRKKFAVGSTDADLYGRLRPGALLNFAVQAAIASADRLGFGYRNLSDKNLIWVLSRMDLILEKPVYWYDELELHTWPKTVDGLLYIRDFEMFRADEKIMRATSSWLAIDPVKKRPHIVKGLIAENFRRLTDKNALEERAARLTFTAPETVETRKTRYFDYDVNQHVTASRYLDWLMDTFEVDFHGSFYASGLSLNFLKEVLPGHTVELRRTIPAEGKYRFEIFNQTLDTVSLRAEISFAPLT